MNETMNGNANGTEATAAGTTQQNSAEDDDPVIHEIPVFLAKTLAGQLCLFQYPVRPAHMSYDTSTVIESRIRPKNKQVEISIALDTDSPSFDQSKGEQIAMNVDGSEPTGKAKKNYEPDEDKLFSSGIMDKQTLTSTKAVRDTSRYAVGILGGNELHITPLSGVLNLKPHLKYLDKSDKTLKAEGRTLDNPDDPEEDTKDDIKAVTVRFAKSDGESAKKAREKSFEWQQKKAEEEPWVPTRFNQVKSVRWEEESQNLFCKKMDEEITSLNQTPEQYLKTLTNL